MGPLIVYCLLVTLASLLGGWLPSLVTLTHRRMQILLSAVAGVMLGVALLHLLPHAAVHLQSLDRACGWVMFGLLAMFFLMRAFHAHSHELEVAVEHAHTHSTGDEGGSPTEHGQEVELEHAREHHEHPHHAHSHHDHAGHGHAAAEPCLGSGASAASPQRRITWVGAALGLTLHTLIDGAALGAAVAVDHAAGGEGGMLAGLGTFAAVALHKPLDSLSIATLMASRGSPPAVRRWVNVAYALACPAGALLFWLGVVQLGESSALLGAALAFAAGVFLCVALADLLPEVEYHSHDRLALSAALIAGVLLAYAIGFLEPAHAHGPRRVHGAHTSAESEDPWHLHGPGGHVHAK